MKCAIVTVYASQNCGSFLQAFALAKKIELLGCEATFVRQSFKKHSQSKISYIKFLCKALLKMDFLAVKLESKKRKAFSRTIKKLNILPGNNVADLYILGSDTIWDISQPYFMYHKDVFWGSKFDKTSVASYAPSVGYAKEISVEQQKWIANALDNMKAISVRDESSYNLIKPFTKKEIEFTCDPTFLISVDEYYKLSRDIVIDYDKFIFLYFYGRMSQEQKKEICTFAQKNNLKIVTFSHLNRWCDVCEPYDPIRFLALYEKAEYVVTNTFHGTVFANIFEKKFAVLNVKKPKVIDLLKRLSKSDKMTNDNNSLEDVLMSDFDYLETKKVIESDRQKGEMYLAKVISLAKQ